MLFLSVSLWDRQLNVLSVVSGVLPRFSRPVSDVLVIWPLSVSHSERLNKSSLTTGVSPQFFGRDE